MNKSLIPTIKFSSALRSYRLIDESTRVVQREVLNTNVRRGDFIELESEVEMTGEQLPKGMMLLVEEVKSEGVVAKILSNHKFNSLVLISH